MDVPEGITSPQQNLGAFLAPLLYLLGIKFEPSEFVKIQTLVINDKGSDKVAGTVTIGKKKTGERTVIDVVKPRKK